MFICKSHTTGRQWRTLLSTYQSIFTTSHIPSNAFYKDVEIGRNSWMKTDIGKSEFGGENICGFSIMEKKEIF